MPKTSRKIYSVSKCCIAKSRIPFKRHGRLHINIFINCKTPVIHSVLINLRPLDVGRSSRRRDYTGAKTHTRYRHIYSTSRYLGLFLGSLDPLSETARNLSRGVGNLTLTRGSYATCGCTGCCISSRFGVGWILNLNSLDA